MLQILLERKVKQTFGRTIRSENDRGALVILDYRAQDFLKQPLKLTRVRNIDQLKDRLEALYTDFPSLNDLRKL
ncbi:MAG: helicase C-terminal domain-containing protein [Candidatus Kariarchaeaceae archaeon]|jgi:Rad3-related DNA helicase